MHVVCASFVLFTEIVYTTQLYNHYRIIVEENSVKYVPLDDLFGIQILPNSISAGAWGSLRRPPQTPQSAGEGHTPPYFHACPDFPRRLQRLAHRASPLSLKVVGSVVFDKAHH